MPPRQSSPGPVYGLGARPKRRTEGRGRDVAAADILAHPALPRIRTHVDGGLPGKRHLPGSREELSALFRAYNLPMPRALPLPPCRASTAGGHAAARPVSGLPAKGAQARPTPAAHPYHQRLRGLLDASSCASHVAPPAPGRLAPLNHDQQRGVSAHQRPPKPQAVPSGLAAAAVAVPKPGRQSGVAVEPLPLPIVLGRPLEVNHGRAAVLPGGGGQAASRASQGGAAAPDQMAQAEEGAADEHEQWDWVYRGPPTPESPYGSDILRAMLNVISPRFEVRRPDGYIPITPSSITSSRYARSDVWSWSCPGSPAPGLRPAPDGSTDASAAAAGGGGGGDACGTGRSPFTAARPSPAAGPTPRHSSPEPLHRKLLLRAAAAAAAAAGDAPQLSRQGSRQGSATAAPLQAAALHDRGCSLTPPGGLGWNLSMRLPHLPQRGSSAGRFTRAAAMGLHADGGHPHQLAFVVPSLAGAGSRPACTPSGC
ncbi:hypothetical protein HXX76_001707 [Chlamydomonas incerta]|uniref:Uncharacterized protein n=1 Tax=Chlamydomonas incerta TaxID=51695 RepID=A0A835TRZ0_CHLIN|nr:hypothetical protein HXX76_001707 [Chlamydomonas incerta]|eukprot:KAG2443345.1 hypothetical protein HXX76_001707 [Chlamydomonas incerta]